MKQFSRLFFLIFILAVSCKEDNPIDPSLAFVGYEYAPLSLNQESVFQIDSIKYDEFSGRIDTFRHQRRELVEESIQDNAGREAFIVGIYERDNDSSSWNKIKVIRKTRTLSRLEVLDDNLNTIKLVFPVADEIKWNTNALNSNTDLEYTYADVNSSSTTNNVVYDSTLTVNQQDEENLIERFFSEAKYATGRGLIYERSIQIETEINGDIRSGYDATLYLLSFSAD